VSEEIKKGLLGIVVDETTISQVMPEINSLTYRGYTVQELCDKCSFEEVAYLVLKAELPNKKQSKKFIKDEEYAKKNKIGMWVMEFEFPWNFRKNKSKRALS